MTASGKISGTPAYMAPEQARGDKTDHRTDIYSLGVVLYEMLAGRVPFDSDSTLSVIYKHINEPPPRIAEIDPAVQNVLDRALAKDPNLRYQSSRDMAVDFYLAIGMTSQAETVYESVHKLSGTMPQPPAPEPKPQPKGNRTWLGVGIFSFICLLALAAVAFIFRSVIFNPPGGAPTDVVQNTAVVPPTEISTPTEGIHLPSGQNMVKIPAGAYEIGKNPADEFHVAPQSIQLQEYWIDQYQVTNSQYQQYMQDQADIPTPVVWPGEDNHPVRGVTWDQAAAYCSWANKRLPTEAEWEAAGRGPGASSQLYPWGTDPTAGGETRNLPDQDTYPVGSLPFNQSPTGVFDLVGNVWEWSGEPYSPVPEGDKVLHGGRFGLLLDLAYRLAVPPDSERYVQFAGFRCAADQTQ
jgi:hypothetical protein